MILTQSKSSTFRPGSLTQNKKENHSEDEPGNHRCRISLGPKKRNGYIARRGGELIMTSEFCQEFHELGKWPSCAVIAGVRLHNASIIPGARQRNSSATRITFCFVGEKRSHYRNG
jgi:hypothetical protein